MSKQLNEADRVAICRNKRDNPKLTQAELVKWVKEKLGKSVTQGTISNTLKRSAEILAGDIENDSKRQRQRKVTYPELEEHLFEWVLNFQHTGQLSGETLKTKAAEIASHLYPGETTLMFSTGWLQKFKKRHGIRQFVAHGESGSVDMAVIEESLPELCRLISSYAPDDVFNVDETGLFFRMQASRFLATKQLEGKKVDKQRLTVVACVNASGSEKLPLWVIGKYARPRCFKRVNMHSLGCEYRANKNAWMTAGLFNEWLQWFSVRMTGRKVLLLMDNCPAHTAGTLDIANTEVKFLPPNTTSKLQPLDGGIIRTLKAHYRRRQALRTLQQFNTGLWPEQGKLDVLDAINILVPAWEADVTANTIANCWKHCGLVDSPAELPPGGLNDAMFELQSVLTRVGYADAIPAQELVDYSGEQEICEIQTEAQFFARLKTGNATAEEEEEDGDDTEERPHYTSIQVHEALEILKGYAMQRGDDDGAGRKAIDAYNRYFSIKLTQAPHQTRLPDLFAKQRSFVELDD